VSTTASTTSSTPTRHSRSSSAASRQSPVGLDAYGDLSGDPRGASLFGTGNGNGTAIVPLSDTESWSRYSVGGPESTRDQHALPADLLGILCRRNGTRVYCDHATRFEQYLAQRGG
jgi:hypothetical protein